MLGAAMVAFWMGDDPVPPPPLQTAARPPATELGAVLAEVRELRELIEHEASARQALEAELDQLASEPFERSPARSPASREWGGQEPAGAETSDQPGADLPRAKAIAQSFDSESLSAVGIPRSEVDRVREAWEEYELARLSLNDRAMREGWFMQPRHGRELWELRWAVRDELGEDLYDALLFATGKENRVVVGDVLPRSASDEAGLEPGDVIVTYAGHRIFEMGELQLATAAGPAGASVPVEVRRGERVYTFQVDRGPLGSLLRSERRLAAAR